MISAERDAGIRGAEAAAADGFQVCVHRGTQQIGGTCIELACDGKCILLDLGLPLDAGDTDPASLLPAVPGLQAPDAGLLALVLSHGHADHWGLAPYAGTVPLVAGAATRRILTAAAAFVPSAIPPAMAGEGVPDLEDRKTIQVGPFSITPFLVDHSAYDAYAMLIEASGRRLFYSGDIRAHGRKGPLFDRLVARPPRPVHAMLMEGSSLGRLNPGQRFPTEDVIEAQLVDRFRPDGFVGVCASAQNIDRVVSIYRACKWTDRTLLLDLYAMEVLRATGNPNLPAAGWPNLAVYVPAEPETLRKILATIRQSGFAMSRGQRSPEGVAVAVPFFDAAGDVVGNLGVTSPAHRYTDAKGRRMLSVLHDMAAELFHGLGGKAAESDTMTGRAHIW